MLQGKRILVVEDEFLLADELATHFREAGATVLGPVPSVVAAARYVDSADGAILDIDLNGEVVFPLADALVEKGVPIVFFSGNADITVPDRFRYAQSLPKPADYRVAANLLLAQNPGAQDDDDVFRMLPKLRLAARLHVGDAQAADRLVERTLKAALEDLSNDRDELSFGEWLNGLMEAIVNSERADILN